MPKIPSYKNKNGQEIDLHVLVYTRPNLRGSYDEMLMYLGRSELNNLFDVCKIDENIKCIHLEYPERWTNIIEQRAIIDRIPVLYPNIEKVTIKTHSVYIIQCTHNQCVGICDDPSKYPEKKYADLNIRYCPPPTEFEGLKVFTPIK